MSEPIKFEIKAHCAVFRLAGELQLMDVIHGMAEAIRAAREQGLRKLMVDATRVAPSSRPIDTASRYFGAPEWAKAAGGQVAVALVSRPEKIASHGYDALNAALLGLQFSMFDSKSKALAWLNTLK
jgi:hypothetical protein